MRIDTYPDEREWPEDDTGQFLKACSKYWPVMNPDSYHRGFTGNEHPAWRAWIEYLVNRHTFDSRKLRVVELNEGVYFNYSELSDSIGHVKGKTAIFIKETILHPDPNRVFFTDSKHTKHLMMVALVRAMVEQEYVEFEEINL